MFGHDQPTALDVNFRIFGFPVRVHPLFWLITALLGEWVRFVFGIEYVLLWVACGFISILLHELGHAVLIRYYGSPSSIVLMAFGGLATNPYPPHSPWKQMSISLAGPVVQLLLVGLLYTTGRLTQWHMTSILAVAIYQFLMVMNLFWAILNLLPIYPLDGGQALQQVFRIFKLRNPDAAIHIVSMSVAGLLVLRGLSGLLHFRIPIVDDYLPSWLVPPLMLTIWLGLFVFINYQLLQVAQRRQRYYRDDFDDDSPPWRR